MGSVTIVSSGTVREDGTGTTGTRHIAKRYPVEQGLEAGTTLQTEHSELEEDC
ncbi:hypothetical protein LCGC14_1749530 [marine sediment metagenome]|uniref:Uncharacterized protein n=1 Tax=marine sediment metagenome TaxID=412755 RepID=A0A0F9K3T2_9ZZZZ